MKILIPETVLIYNDADRLSDWLEGDASTANCHPITLEVESLQPGKISDGYHTFDELYEHRCLLFLAFLKLGINGGVREFKASDAHKNAWRSRKHHDGSAWEGWFIAGCQLNGKQVTYHLPDKMWELCDFIPEYPAAPYEWDGHTPGDVCDRLRQWLTT